MPPPAPRPRCRHERAGGGHAFLPPPARHAAGGSAAWLEDGAAGAGRHARLAVPQCRCARCSSRRVDDAGSPAAAGSTCFAPSAAAAGHAGARSAAPMSGQKRPRPALLRPAASPRRVGRSPAARQPGAAGRQCAARHPHCRPAHGVRLCTLAGEFGNGPDARVLGARRLALFVSASIERGTRWVTIEGNTRAQPRAGMPPGGRVPARSWPRRAPLPASSAIITISCSATSA